ncbi:MAG: site-2 protease family protein [Caulobacter sp.]|nr:site-2 protease family protein [Caulobacter sp.]
MSRNAVLLLAAWVLSGAALVLLKSPPGFLTFLFVMLGWVVALAVHEFGHAFIAWQAGDHTVTDKGYLSFDPLKYTDPATSIIIPVVVLAIGGIALPGGAVYLREDLMRSPAWRSAASLAGPVGTLIALIVLSLLLAAGGPAIRTGALGPAIAVLALFQAMALIFNLLPAPGLDGYGVIRPLLPPTVRARLEPLERFAIYALIAVVFFVPGASGLLIGGAASLAALFGVDINLIVQGWDSFEFWR